MILKSYFSENENCDAKMIIPINSESYRKRNIFLPTVQPSNGFNTKPDQMYLPFAVGRC